MVCSRSVIMNFRSVFLIGSSGAPSALPPHSPLVSAVQEDPSCGQSVRVLLGGLAQLGPQTQGLHSVSGPGGGRGRRPGRSDVHLCLLCSSKASNWKEEKPPECPGGSRGRGATDCLLAW